MVIKTVVAAVVGSLYKPLVDVEQGGKKTVKENISHHHHILACKIKLRYVNKNAAKQSLRLQICCGMWECLCLAIKHTHADSGFGTQTGDATRNQLGNGEREQDQFWMSVGEVNDQ